MKNICAKKLIKRISAFAASMVLLLGSSLVAHADAKYTYCYDYWGDVQDSPDAYEVIDVFDVLDLGLPELVEKVMGSAEVTEEIEEGEEGEEGEEETEEEEASEEGNSEEGGSEGGEEGGSEGGEEGSEEGSTSGRKNQKADLRSKSISNTAASITVNGNFIYLCDSGNNRIIKIQRINREQFKAVDIFWKIGGNVKKNTFENPTDIQFDEDGNIYVADNGNERVVKMDSNWNYIMEFVKPNDSTMENVQDFLPNKIVVDTAGRIYCIADNVNDGLLKYEADGVFAGYVGAPPVVYNFWDYVQKRFATQAQREKLVSFVPTEYSNIYMDHDGFIYACACNLKEEDLKSGSANAVRRLNLMGNDILIKNGNYPPYGDIYMGNGGPSQIVDVTAFDNDAYAMIDRRRGRIFVYDDQGRMLFAFGGKGNMKGYFKDGTISLSLDHMGYDLIAMDSSNASITVFTPTEYGNLIYTAMDQFDAGLYSESGETWQKIMDINGNYDLAYIGVGRALLRQEKYKEAMEYFELKYDDDNYSKAFKQYRKEWVEKHILAIFIVAFAVLIVPMIIGKIGKIKYEIDTADIFKF